MRLIIQVVPRDYNILSISCTHFGSVLHTESGFASLVDKVTHSYEGLKPVRNFVVHHGDHVEGKLIDHPHFYMATNQSADILPQVWRTVEAYKPIRKHIVALLEGNHDRALWKFGNIPALISKDLYGNFDRYATASCRIHWITKSGDILFKQFATHGYKSIGSVSPDPVRNFANLQYQLKDRLRKKAGDCFLMTRGHSHKLFTVPPMQELYLHDNGQSVHSDYTSTSQSRTWIHPDHRWYISVGAFYRVYGSELTKYDPEDPTHSVLSSYVETSDHDPVQLGYAVILVRDGKIVKVNEEFVS